jgi:hypothetical protein
VCELIILVSVVSSVVTAVNISDLSSLKTEHVTNANQSKVADAVIDACVTNRTYMLSPQGLPRDNEPRFQDQSFSPLSRTVIFCFSHDLPTISCSEQHEFNLNPHK